MPTLVRRLLRTGVIIVICVAAWIAMIYFGQDRMIYFPRGYYSGSKWFNRVDEIKYVSGECFQASYLYPKGREEKPERIWFLFGGNGSTALDWITILQRSRIPEGVVCVLVDYPGYGRCRGKPGPEPIFTSIGVLMDKLSEHWEMDKEEISRRSYALGHSLGAAVALKAAADFEMQGVVAVSPFTSMSDMAKRKVGALHVLLRHHYDNRESIVRLVNRESPADILIFHGTSDSLIPAKMGKELADLAGIENAIFHPVKGRGHNDILRHIEEELIREISKPTPLR